LCFFFGSYLLVLFVLFLGIFEGRSLRLWEDRRAFLLEKGISPLLGLLRERGIRFLSFFYLFLLCSFLFWVLFRNFISFFNYKFM
jgi:hypothetical protein